MDKIPDFDRGPRPQKTGPLSPGVPAVMATRLVPGNGSPTSFSGDLGNQIPIFWGNLQV